MDVFNNREWALIIWFFIAVIFILISPKTEKIRIAFDNVVHAFFHKTIITTITLMLVHTSLIIYTLYELGIWEVSQTKNTVIWFVSFGFLSMFKMSKIKDEPRFFKSSVLDSLKLITVIEYIVHFYSFNIFVELLLVPFLFIVGGMLAISEGDEKYLLVNKFLNIIMIIFGTIVIAYTIYMLFTEFGEFAKEQTVYDYIIPLLLTLLFLPFIFVMLVYSTYKQVFLRLNFSIKDPKLRFFTKLMALIIFNFSIKLLERWKTNLTYADTNTYKGIWNSFKQIFKIIKLEKTPKDIPITDGWSPYKAKFFLSSEGLETGDYNPFSDEWYAGSQTVEIDKEILPNTISYYIYGNESAVKRLKLNLL